MEEEETIRKKKDKKLGKHFDGMINDQKIKLLNYRIKKYETRFESIEVIELISKVKFDGLAEKNALIWIKKGDQTIKILGDWKYAWNGPGNYGVAYSIKEKL